MPSAPVRTVGKAAVERISGSGPGPMTAFVTAVIIGVAAAAATYRLLRSGR